MNKVLGRRFPCISITCGFARTGWLQNCTVNHIILYLCMTLWAQGAYLALSRPVTKVWMLWPILNPTITPAPPSPAKLNWTSALFSLGCHDSPQVLEKVRNFRICVSATYKSPDHPPNDHASSSATKSFDYHDMNGTEWNTMFLMNHLSQFKSNCRI